MRSTRRPILTLLSCCAALCAVMMGCGLTRAIDAASCPEVATPCVCPGERIGEVSCDVEAGEQGACLCPEPDAPDMRERDQPDDSVTAPPDLGGEEEMELDMPLDQAGDDELPEEMPDQELDQPHTCDGGGCEEMGGEELLPCEEIEGEELPAGFSSQDIGEVGVPGATRARGARICMQASGRDIWAHDDEFRYTHTEWTGDLDVRVEISSLVGDHPYTKAGLMVRESLEADARFMLLQLTRDEQPFVIGRAVPGEYIASSTPITSGRAPIWVRLIRSGDVFQSLVSEDGVTWRASGEIVLGAMPERAYVGLALSNHQDTSLASATFDHLSLTAPATPCPAELDCAALDDARHLDFARLGGLNLDDFRGSTVQTLTVTSSADQGGGSLRDRMNKALQRADLGLYTIIEVDRAQVTSPITLSSPLPEVRQVWLRGHGATLTASTTAGELDGALTLGSKVILEGFQISGVGSAVRLDGASSGVWIHHNSFSLQSGGPFVQIADTQGKNRYITISYNEFGDDVSSAESAIYTTLRDCPPQTSCSDDTSSLYLSIHHNHFQRSIAKGYPYGGGRIVYYNNVVEDLSSEGIDLAGSGQILSRRNIFRTSSPTSVSVFRNGNPSTSRNTVGDRYEMGVTPDYNEHTLSFAAVFSPQLYIDFQELIDTLERAAGATAVMN